MRCCGRLDCIEGKWVTRCLVVVLPVFGLREEGSARGAGGAGGAGGARLRKRLVSGRYWLSGMSRIPSTLL